MILYKQMTLLALCLIEFYLHKSFYCFCVFMSSYYFKQQEKKKNKDRDRMFEAFCLGEFSKSKEIQEAVSLDCSALKEMLEQLKSVNQTFEKKALESRLRQSANQPNPKEEALWIN